MSNEVESLKEKISQLEYELSHYKTGNEELVSKLAKANRQLSKVNNYNEELRQQLEVLSTELHEYRKIKSTNETIEIVKQTKNDIGVQVCSDDFEIVFESKALPVWSLDDKKEDFSVDTSSIADTLKATAEAVLHSQSSTSSQADSTTFPVNSSSYVYDETSQMYYDYNSGYYIDTKNNLYYDPKSGTYFYYNEATQKYEFHSQVDITQNSTNQSNHSKQKKHQKKERHKTPSKKEESRHKKHKRSRSESAERSSSKKRKKSKSRKNKKNSREDNSFRDNSTTSRDKPEKKDKSKHVEKIDNSKKKLKTNSDIVICEDSEIYTEIHEDCGGQQDVNYSNTETISIVDTSGKYEIVPMETDVQPSPSLLQVKNNESVTKVKNENTDFNCSQKINSTDSISKVTVDKTEIIKPNVEVDMKTKITDVAKILDKIDDVEEIGGEVLIMSNKFRNSEKNVTENTVKDRKIDMNSENCENKEDLRVEDDVSVCTGESELESGELSSDSTDSEPDSETDNEGDKVDEIQEIVSQFVEYVGDEKYQQQANEASTSWPPCIRVIVQESDCLDEGDLFIITCTGGSIGREKGKNHVIDINDINISRNHCKIWFEYEQNQYLIKDEGSQHGTVINNNRLSKHNEESEELALAHGDVLNLGNSEFLLHIHPGLETCLDCEPGEVKARMKRKTEPTNNVVILTAEEKKKQQKAQLNSIKQRYGLKNTAYVDNKEVLNNPAYEDKAAERRKKVGSDGPGHRSEAAASVHRPISGKNKGHKLLSKMGWKEGEGLGKASSGIVDPINVAYRANMAAGFGSSAGNSQSIENVDGTAAKKINIWRQTQERYHQIEKTTDQIDDMFVEKTKMEINKGSNTQSKSKKNLLIKGTKNESVND